MSDQPIKWESLDIDDEATRVEIEAIREATARAGFEAGAIEANIGHRSVADIPWVVYATAAGGWLLGKYFGAMADEAGRDHYRRFLKWWHEVRDARSAAGRENGSVVLRDSEHTNVVLSTNIPDEAVEQLRDLDWSKVRGDYLVWDGTRRAWGDPLKTHRKGGDEAS